MTDTRSEPGTLFAVERRDPLVDLLIAGDLAPGVATIRVPMSPEEARSLGALLIAASAQVDPIAFQREIDQAAAAVTLARADTGRPH